MNAVSFGSFRTYKSQVKHKKGVMAHFHGGVYGDREDLTVIWEDAEVDDGSRVAFQNTNWFPEKKKQNQEEVAFLS